MNETKADSTGSGKPRVAVVDDDESVREALQSLLRSVGYRAEGFDSAEAFLLSGRLPEMDCLILDVKMPGMGGMALQEGLERIKPPLPTVFLTAHGDEATRRQAMHLGAVGFLRKPCSDEDLLNAVRQALELNRLHSN
ncbi:MAG TPA: response regulator [Candidatus Acidoferrum sp.]|jgi:FixJ family two-component response regulator|nr:response regulator [Candidatus Acidoferrum sp.]